MRTDARTPVSLVEAGLCWTATTLAVSAPISAIVEIADLMIVLPFHFVVSDDLSLDTHHRY
jgi:hypothetical protein